MLSMHFGYIKTQQLSSGPYCLVWTCIQLAASDFVRRKAYEMMELNLLSKLQTVDSKKHPPGFFAITRDPGHY